MGSWLLGRQNYDRCPLTHPPPLRLPVRPLRLTDWEKKKLSLQIHNHTQHACRCPSCVSWWTDPWRSSTIGVPVGVGRPLHQQSHRTHTITRLCTIKLHWSPPAWFSIAQEKRIPQINPSRLHLSFLLLQQIFLNCYDLCCIDFFYPIN